LEAEKMNLRLVCKFAVSRAGQVLAARLNQEKIDLLSVHPSDRSGLTGPEQMALRQFVELARTLMVAPNINVEQVNTLVHEAGRLVELLVHPRRKPPPSPNHLPKFGSMEWPDDLDDYVLALAGVRAGTYYNVIARNMWGR
jgi:hypothetical protein